MTRFAQAQLVIFRQRTKRKKMPEGLQNFI